MECLWRGFLDSGADSSSPEDDELATAPFRPGAAASRSLLEDRLTDLSVEVE